MRSLFIYLFNLRQGDYVLPSSGWGIKRWRPSSVCLSVSSVDTPKSTMERCSKLKIGRKDTYDTADPWPNLEIERSKVKGIRTLTENRPYLRNRKAYELQTWCADGDPTCAVTCTTGCIACYVSCIFLWHMMMMTMMMMNVSQNQSSRSQAVSGIKLGTCGPIYFNFF